MIKPSSNQITRTKAVLPISQLPATSCVAKPFGKKTERIPWVSHFKGKRAANCCIQDGSEVKTKNTPLKNCKMITIGETTADALRPLLGTIENAIPRMVEHALPSKTSQVKFHQRFVWVGRFKSKTTEPKNNSNAVWITIKKVTSNALPMK